MVQRHVIGVFGLFVKTDEEDLVKGGWVGGEESPHRSDGNGGGPVQRESIDAGADGGKGDGPAVMRQGQFQTGAVTGGQHSLLPMSAAVPYRTGGMQNVFCGQRITFCNFSAPCFTAVQGPAFSQEGRAGPPVDGPVHTPSSQKRGIGGVDDGICPDLCDVAQQGADGLTHRRCRVPARGRRPSRRPRLRGAGPAERPGR